MPKFECGWSSLSAKLSVLPWSPSSDFLLNWITPFYALWSLVNFMICFMMGKLALFGSFMDTLKLDPFEWAAENLLPTAGLLFWSSNADFRSPSFDGLVCSRSLPRSDLSPEFSLLTSVVEV